MKISTGIKLELLKLRHTGFWAIQLLIILVITLGLNGYYVLYGFREVVPRIKMIFEFLGILIPVTSSISIALLVRTEEQIANMYGILGVRHRKKIVMGILFISWSITVLQLLVMVISLAVLGRIWGSDLQNLLLLSCGMMIFSLFYPIFHLFLHLRFGIGFSMLVGVFECMQSVMYSNIHLAGIFRYIPSAWLMEWKTCILAGELSESFFFWIICLLMLLTFLALLLIWIERWEGRKNYGE